MLDAHKYILKQLEGNEAQDECKYRRNKRYQHTVQYFTMMCVCVSQ